jgi:hypothetical protein
METLSCHRSRDSDRLSFGLLHVGVSDSLWEERGGRGDVEDGGGVAAPGSGLTPVAAGVEVRVGGVGGGGAVGVRKSSGGTGKKLSV